METTANGDRASAVALPNPEQELRAGERLSFTAHRLVFDGENGYYMPLGAQNGMLLALSFRDSAGHHTYGSGVIVGPGLALCAAHVLHDQDFYGKLQRDEATLIAQAPLPDGGMLLWTVLRIALVPYTDLAVLSMSLASPYPASRHFVTASLTTRMPSLGEVLTVTGLSAAGDGTEAIARDTRIAMAPHCRFGRVIDRYPSGRDRRMPGPCLAVDCAVPGGTSGGPVFDSRGYLVGLLSASYDASTFPSSPTSGPRSCEHKRILFGHPHRIPDRRPDHFCSWATRSAYPSNAQTPFDCAVNTTWLRSNTSPGSRPL